MANPDFRSILPGKPLDQEFFKKESWEKESSCDYSFENGGHRDVAVGTAELLKKYANATKYNNEELGLQLIAVNHLDYGPSYIKWTLLNDPSPNKLAGHAIYVKGRWVIQKPEEEFDMAVELKIIGNEKIIQKVILKFVKENNGVKIATVRLEIIREEF